LTAHCWWTSLSNSTLRDQSSDGLDVDQPWRNLGKSLCALGHRFSPAPPISLIIEREMCAMTKFPLRMLMRFQEWFEVHLIRWRPAYLELTDEQLMDIGLEPLKRNFNAVRPFWMP